MFIVIINGHGTLGDPKRVCLILAMLPDLVSKLADNIDIVEMIKREEVIITLVFKNSKDTRDNDDD